MKFIVISVAIVAVLSVSIAIKSWQYQSCRQDGLSVGTCIAVIGK